MNTLNYISLAVPDIKVAADWFTQVVGPPASGKALFEFDPSVTVKLVECKSSELGLPSIFDLGTLHLCFRVRNIEKVANTLISLDDTRLMGDIVDTGEGPIEGNRWIYFKAPWGTLFELQEWPNLPAYMSNSSVRLYHEHPVQRPGALYGIQGLDHAGYSVSDLESAIMNLNDLAGGVVVLRTEISVDADFTYRQFGVDVASTSRMAMVAIDGLNLELFEHGVSDKNPPRAITELGGHELTLGESKWASDLSEGIAPKRRMNFDFPG